MKIVSGLMIAAALASLALAGCSRKPAGLTPKEKQVFDSAPPEVKQNWDAALAAEKANDYVASLSLFNELLQQNLSPEQRDAASKEMTALNQRMYDAANKGDAAAKKAVEDLQHNPPNRRRGL